MKDGITKVLVTGSRKWDNWNLIREALEPYFGLDVVLMHGDAAGADKMAAFVWENWGGTTKAVPANWERFGKSAGIRRNEGMVLSGPDVVVAFIRDESRGATHCAEFAKARGITVVTVQYAEPTTAPASGDTSAEAKVPAF